MNILENSGIKVNANQINAFENLSGLTLPVSFKDFLTTQNGGEPRNNILIHETVPYVVTRLLSLSEIKESYRTLCDTEIIRDNNLLCIATTIGSIVLAIKCEGEGNIYLVDFGEYVPRFVCSDINILIKNLVTENEIN